MTNTEDEETNQCPVNGCNWWVPEGMEYLYTEHRYEHESILPMKWFALKRWISWQRTKLMLWRNHE